MKPITKRCGLLRFRLSLRGLMAAVLIIGGGLGVIAAFVRSVQVQRDTVAAVRKAGGYVLYNWQFDGKQIRRDKGKSSVTQTVPRWPKWLVDRMGFDYFGVVTEVDLMNQNPNDGLAALPPAHFDQALMEVGNLTWLETLCLYDTGVSDGGLAQVERLLHLESLVFFGKNTITDAGVYRLRGLKRLKHLHLDGSQVGDSGLASIKELTALEALSLNSTRISDAGLVHLADLPHLKYLWLNGNNISDAGVIPVAKRLTQLRALDVSDTKITDALIEHLADLSDLCSLVVRNTAVTDDALEHLRRLDKLHALELHGTRISDKGLMHLKSLAGLRYVSISNTRVTGPALKDLMLAKPGLRYLP